MRNRKGSGFDLIIWMVVAFVILIFFAGWIYAYNLLTESVLAVPNPPGNIVNITSAAEATFGQINEGYQSLRWVALVIVVAMIMSIFISSFVVKAHPVFLIVELLMLIVSIIFSVYISNAYESMLTSTNPLTATLRSFSALDWIMLNLPAWTVVIGVGGMIFLFIGVTLSKGDGGNVRI